MVDADEGTGGVMCALFPCVDYMVFGVFQMRKFLGIFDCFGNELVEMLDHLPSALWEWMIYLALFDHSIQRLFDRVAGVEPQIIELGAIHGKGLDLDHLVEFLLFDDLDLALRTYVLVRIVNQVFEDARRFRANVVDLIQITPAHDHVQSIRTIPYIHVGPVELSVFVEFDIPVFLHFVDQVLERILLLGSSLISRSYDVTQTQDPIVQSESLGKGNEQLFGCVFGDGVESGWTTLFVFTSRTGAFETPAFTIDKP